MEDIKDVELSKPDSNTEDPFSQSRRLKFGPLRISKEGIFVDNGTNDVVKISDSGFQGYDSNSINTITLNSTGFHAYNTSGNELIKIDSAGFHGYLTAGTETIRISGSGIEGYGTTGNTFQFYDSQGGTKYGQIGYLSASGATYLASFSGKDIYFNSDKAVLINAGTGAIINAGDDGGAGDILLDTSDGTGEVYLKGSDQGSANSSGVFFYNWDTTSYNEKTAIMPTSKGYKALYCTESPEVWFFDFCYGKKVIKNLLQFWKTEWEVKPDPLFLEVTEPPYTVIQTGIKNIVQFWGRRKDTKDKRFATKTETEFKENNKFWSEPMRRAQKG